MRLTHSPPIYPNRTALRRKKLSAPLKKAFADGVLASGDAYGDVGCGHGDDCRLLLDQYGVDAIGEDKHLRLEQIDRLVDVAGLIYVLNTDPDPESRRIVLKRTFSLAKRVLVVAVRTRQPRDLVCQPYGDGVLTQRRTFQKFYSDEELARYVEKVLAEPLHRASSGMGYVFKDSAAAARYQARKQRNDPSTDQAVAQRALAKIRAGVNTLSSRVAEQPAHRFRRSHS